MNTSGKQMVAFWLHKRGRQLTYKTIDKEEGSNIKKCALYHYRPRNGSFKSAVVIKIRQSLVDETSKVLLLFQSKNKKICHIETRVTPEGQHELYIEIESANMTECNQINNILETLSSIDIHPREENHMEQVEKQQLDMDADEMWFPKSINDLDHFQRVLMIGTDLDVDHPGATDATYRKRRRLFAEIAIFYRHGHPIPRVKYTPEENYTWRTIYNTLTKLHKKYASREFLKYWGELEQYCGYGPENIPQLDDINKYLKWKTGFQVRPVAGYLSPRDFLSGLAFRVFHCTQYIRHSSDPFYTPEPDCCHEILGHVPLFADETFAQFSQQIGLCSLGASDEDVSRLASCYFFTIEFGLVIEDGQLKVYGAGLLSSVAELKHVVEGVRTQAVSVTPFKCEEAVRTPCIVTDYQRRYFVSNSIEEAKEELTRFARNIRHKENIRYNPYTQTVEVIAKEASDKDTDEDDEGNNNSDGEGSVPEPDDIKKEIRRLMKNESK